MNSKGVLTCVAICVASVLILAPTFAISAQEDFPHKTITWIVPFTPGGGFDLYSRVLARTMPKYLPRKVTIVVKNVPGAGGRRGSAMLYRSKPDGYTIGILNIVGLAALDVVKKAKEYDLLKFTYLGVCARCVGGTFVPTNSPFNTLKDLQNAKRVRFAMSGVGASSWLYAKIAEAVMKIPVHYVSGYGGSTQFVVATIRGDADAVHTGDANTEVRYVKSGDLKPVIMWTLEPWERMPEAPTLKGTPYEELAVLYLDRDIAAPPGLPKKVAGILEGALMKALNDPEIRAWAKKANRELTPFSGKEALSSVESQLRLFSKYKDALKTK